MEIERKFLVPRLPEDLAAYPSCEIEQAYLCRDPVVRIRRQEEDYILTYKGRGKMAREEYNLPLNAGAYAHLKEKADGNVIAKRRYRIPCGNYTIELDVFQKPFHDMCMAEVEFLTIEEALAFTPPEWMKEDVTEDSRFHNSRMSETMYTDGSFWKQKIK